MWLPPRKCSQNSHETGSGASLKKQICKYQDGQNGLERAATTTTTTTTTTPTAAATATATATTTTTTTTTALLTTFFILWLGWFKLPLIICSSFAKEKKVKTIAFPILGGGIFRGCRPLRQVVAINLRGILEGAYEGALSLDFGVFFLNQEFLSWFILHLRRIHNLAFITVVTGPLCSWLLENQSGSEGVFVKWNM